MFLVIMILLLVKLQNLIWTEASAKGSFATFKNYYFHDAVVQRCAVFALEEALLCSRTVVLIPECNVVCYNRGMAGGPHPNEIKSGLVLKINETLTEQCDRS